MQLTKKRFHRSADYASSVGGVPMNLEQELVRFVSHAAYEDLRSDARKTIKNQLLTVLGTTVAGAAQAGCRALVDFYLSQAGKPEASILVHGGRIPAQSAALVNGVMARALDFDDALAPGVHIGASTVSAAIAAAELRGGIDGREFLTALVVGAETGVRLNLPEAGYNGLDPTGICTVFAATATVSRVLGLSEDETWNALALAFNRAGGSFQSNVDGSLAVRVIQGWVSESSLICARFARAGISGPRNFLSGVYGYYHVYGKGLVDPQKALADLGKRFDCERIVFKKYPSCGLTQGITDLVLALMHEKGVSISAENVEKVEVKVPPYTYKLVGHPFEVGSTPRVNAQFSIRYCVANALLRGSSRLAHFEEQAIRDPRVVELTTRVDVVVDQAMDLRGHTPVDMTVHTKDGKSLFRQMDIAPGFPGNPLSDQEQEARFRGCIAYADKPMDKEKVEEIFARVAHIEKLKDVRVLIPLLSH
ncbi:MAG: MmgE/PrpD family protein [Desulfobacteraceae bacterium]|nr:MAG: MmgE/PrpD family protein [Desulfobacteraceae bacterium]